MGVEYRLLGPLEVLVEGRAAQRMIDELWGEEPPASASNLVQGAISHLRKVVGRDVIATRGAGYSLSVEPDALDLQRFERLAEAGSIAHACASS